MKHSTTTRHTDNAFEKRRLPALVGLFPLESGVALSRTVVEMTLIQTRQAPTTHDTNTRVKLTILTILSISECLVIANLSQIPLQEYSRAEGWKGCSCKGRSVTSQRRVGATLPVWFGERQGGAPKPEVTPVEGVLRRAPEPERAPRDASLGVKVTPNDKGPHDILLEESRDDITGPVQRALGRTPVSVPDLTPVEGAL